MAYSELIKSFDKIRGYMRQFYVFGFKRREEYDTKSLRSYDNERRRIESWMGECMSFRQNEAGKQVFLSVDSRTIRHNPLYKAFKAKSFTDNDLILHCYLLSMLVDGEARSAHGIIEGVAELLGRFPQLKLLDDSTIRKKLREYEDLGLLIGEKRGRELFYRLTPESVDRSSWQEAVEFFAEADPLGVIGSYILDRSEEDRELFGFKHHYILHALDGEVLLSALEAIGDHRRVRLTNVSLRSGQACEHLAYPLRIYISTQSGRQYLLCWHYGLRRMQFFRMDAITKIKLEEPEPEPDRFADSYDRFRKNLWGVSGGRDHSMDHVEMDVRVEDDEWFIPQRLERERRWGHVEQIDEHTWRFTADVYDTSEMLPWLRTFIGRILRLEFSNPKVRRTWQDDMRALARAYGEEDDHAVQ
jgi:hypothetical protein